MSKLLLEEKPLQVLPMLAKTIGLNEAIILQQIYWWLCESKHEHEGHRWIYNSYPQWQKQFPWWSIVTIKRTIRRLEKLGLLIPGKFNKAKFDKTKWYRIDQEAVENLSSGQNDPTMGSKEPHEKVSMISPIPESTTETTKTETTDNNKNGRKSPPSPFRGDLTIVMDKLQELRGYPSGAYAAEAKAVKVMLSLGYTASDICLCYMDLKKDQFWKDKALHLMSVAKEIGNWKGKGAVPERSKYFEGKYGSVVTKT